MATKRTCNPTALAKKISRLEEGTRRHLGGGARVIVVGVPLNAAQILFKLATAERHYGHVKAARAAATSELAAYHAALPDLKLFIANYESSLKAQLGVDSPTLRDFGIGRKGTRRVYKPALTMRARTLSEAVLFVAGPSGNPDSLSPAKGSGQR